ncbi:MAG: extracellular solute-binding protein [Lachnospiraceae bacterium]|jgi:multiple sugar transport system substrate-binding protein|nr:extracellular solute-binding protein [Lachnospiraceae bacterium]
MREKLISIALVFTMLCGGLAACNVNTLPPELPDGNVDFANINPEGNVQGGEVESPAFSGINSAARYRYELGLNPDQFADRTLTIWTFWDLSDEEADHIAAFEAATGATVEYINRFTWEMYEPDLIKAIASGDGPDICYFMSEVIPSWVMKGFLVPVSDYIDFSTVTLSLGKGTMEFYTFNGKLYTVPDFHEGSSKLYFRRDIFANAGLRNPYELYLDGEWTWDAFVRLAQDVKEDLTGDGEYDIWGYYSWQWEQLLYSNGANHVQWIDGNPVQGLDDPRAIRAFEWERALGEQYDIIAPWDPDLDPPGMLVAGKIAMMYWGAWLIEGLREELGDKLGFAPFPRGPDLPADVPMADIASGHREGIAGASREPELAALYMLFKRLYENEAAEAVALAEQEPERIQLYGSLEEYELAVEMDKNSTWNAIYGFTGLDAIVTRIRNADDMSAAQAVEAYKSMGQQMIDRTWGTNE